MKLFDETFRHLFFRMVNNVVDTSEVVDSLYNIIYIHCLVSNTDSICLEDLACLIMCQTTTLDVIGVIGQINLCTMVNAALHA